MKMLVRWFLSVVIVAFVNGCNNSGEPIPVEKIAGNGKIYSAIGVPNVVDNVMGIMIIREINKGKLICISYESDFFSEEGKKLSTGIFFQIEKKKRYHEYSNWTEYYFREVKP